MPNILSCCQAQDKEDPTEELKKYFLHLAKAVDEEKIDLKHINELLCKGADINVQDGKGKTPLHEVAKCWHPDVAKFMLDNNADVNKRDQDGFTPLHTAAAEDYKEMVEYLLCDRAEITRSVVTVASAYNASQVLCFLRHKGVKMNILDLREAARGGAVDTCTFLIETVGIDVNEGDKDGIRPLHLAAMMNHVDVLELLINKNACISAKTTCCQHSALFFAAANDATETLAILVKKGADIHQRDCKGRTPLMVAAQRGCSNTCSFLLTKGAQTDLIDPNGEPCIVTILTKVPGVAFNALDKFYKEDIGNRRRYFYLNNVEPNQPGNDEQKSGLMQKLQGTFACCCKNGKDNGQEKSGENNADANTGDNEQECQECKVMQKMCGHPARSSKNCGNGEDRKNQNMTDERGQICNVMQNIRGFCNCSEKKENDNGEDKPMEINFDEPWPKKPDERCLTPMETIVVYRQHDNIRHPVIRKLIKEKWKQFGRREAVFELLRDVTFILLWTPLSLLRPYARACYYFPDDVYRVLLGIAAVVYTLVLFVRDLKAGLHKRQRFEKWKKWKLETLGFLPACKTGCILFEKSTKKKPLDCEQTDENNGTERKEEHKSFAGSIINSCCLCQDCQLSLKEGKQTQAESDKSENKEAGSFKSTCKHSHPDSLQEGEETESEEKEVKKMPAGSMRTAWNYYNWFVYILLVICVTLHIYDVITVPQAICIANAVANSTKAKDEIPQTTVHIWQTYIFSATIILIWQRIFKSTRAFTQLGPFINKYYNARIDVMRYIFLYSAFLIPYTCIFWMVFGGLVENYETILETLFSLFRMTLVDDYNYDELREVNPVACDILVGTFLAIAAITIINMFVGALTDSFLSSGEEVESNALMTRAWMILDFEHNLSKSERNRYLTHIHKNRAPLEKRKIYKGNKHLKKKPKTTEDTVEELTKIVDKQKTEISVMKEDMRSLCKMYDGVFNIMTEKRKASAETEA